MTNFRSGGPGTPYDGPIIGAPGSASSPGIAVRSLAAGIWSPAEAQLAIVVAGAPALTVTATSLALAVGGTTVLSASATGITSALPLLQPVQNTITAHAGGTQAAAFALTAIINRVSVCATSGDSVRLPVSQAGMIVVVINDGAALCQVYGAGTDTIDAVATATGVPVTNATRALFFCVVAGLWQSMGGAKAT